MKPSLRMAPSGQERAIFTKLNQTRGEALLNDLIAEPEVHRSATASRLITIGLACLVNGLTVALLVLGVALLLGPTLGYIILGILCLLITIPLRPRLGRAPRRVLDRTQAASLYRLADDIADKLGARPIHAIVLVSDFQADAVRLGLLRRRYLFLGAPLIGVLSPLERVALLGHELGPAHASDPRNTPFVGTAIRSLDTWSALTAPAGSAEQLPGAYPRRFRRFGDGGYFGALVVNVFMFIPSMLSRGMSRLMMRSVWSDTQRSIYLSDDQAALIAGTEAALGMLDGLRFAALYGQLLDEAEGSGTTVGLFESFEAQVTKSRAPTQGAPVKTKTSAIGAIPTLEWRERFLRSRSHPVVKALGYDESAQIDSELAPITAEVERRIGLDG